MGYQDKESELKEHLHRWVMPMAEAGVKMIGASMGDKVKECLILRENYPNSQKLYNAASSTWKNIEPQSCTRIIRPMLELMVCLSIAERVFFWNWFRLFVKECRKEGLI